MKKLHPASVFKPWIVRRPDGGCQVLFPLSELDGLIAQILPRWRSVEDDPPPVDTDSCLVSDGTDVTVARYITNYGTDIWYGWAPDCTDPPDAELWMDDEDIKWWMPKPEPPKRKEVVVDEKDFCS